MRYNREGRNDSSFDIRGKWEYITLTKYIRAAMGKARYEILPDDGSFYGEIVGFNGVCTNADTLEKCRDELEEVLEGWILLRVSMHFPLPTNKLTWE